MKKEIYKALMHSDEIIVFAKNLFESCKNSTGDTLRTEFITALAGFAHEQAQKEREKEDNDM